MTTPIIPGAYGQRTGNGGSPIGGQGNLLIAIVGRGDAVLSAPVISASSYSGATTVVGTATPGFVTSGTKYYVITAYNAQGETVKSSVEAAVPVTYVATPQSVFLRWTLVRGATGYKIYRGASSGTYTTPSLLATVVGAATSFEDANIALTTGAPPATNTALFIPYNTPHLYFSMSELRGNHGSSSMLGKASVVADRLNISRVLAVSVNYTTVDAATGDPAKLAAKLVVYRAALAALEAYECRVVVCLEPDPTITAIAKAHAITMHSIEPKMYRTVVAASALTDTIGDSVTAATISTNIKSLSNELLIMVAPNIATLTYLADDGSVVTEAQDGSMNAMFAACLKASMADEAEQITNKSATVFDDYATHYKQSEIEYLIQSGACVFTQDSTGQQKCIKGITTDITTVENNEWSIVQSDFRVGTEVVAATLFAVGRKINQQLLDTVTDKVGVVLLGLAGTIITSFSGLEVNQDKLNPTWIDVKFAYKPMYSANVVMFSWSYDTKVASA